MDSNLMSSTCLQLDFNETVTGKFLHNLKVRNCGLTVFLNRHFFAILWMPGNVGFDGSTGGHDSLGYCQVFAFHQALLQLIDQASVGFQGSSHYHDTGCVLIETMYYPGTRQLFQLGIYIQQAIDQRPPAMSCCRMYNQVGGFINDDNLYCLVYMEHLFAFKSGNITD